MAETLQAVEIDPQNNDFGFSNDDNVYMNMEPGPAQVEPEPYVPPHAVYETQQPVQAKPVPVYAKPDKKKVSTQKTVQSSRHIELMEWLPTLPQLFAYLGFTQAVIMFWVFVAECANDMVPTRDWVLVMMWLTVVLLTALFSIYQFLVKGNILRTLVATLFSFLLLIFLFVYPIGASRSLTSSAGRAVLYVFRFLITVFIVGVYCAAYSEDLALDQVQERLQGMGNKEPKPAKQQDPSVVIVN